MSFSLITKIKRLPLLNTIFEESVVLCVACLLSYVFEVMGECLILMIIVLEVNIRIAPQYLSQTKSFVIRKERSIICNKSELNYTVTPSRPLLQIYKGLFFNFILLLFSLPSVTVFFSSYFISLSFVSSSSSFIFLSCFLSYF